MPDDLSQRLEMSQKTETPDISYNDESVLGLIDDSQKNFLALNILSQDIYELFSSQEIESITGDIELFFERVQILSAEQIAVIQPVNLIQIFQTSDFTHKLHSLSRCKISELVQLDFAEIVRMNASKIEALHMMFQGQGSFSLQEFYNMSTAEACHRAYWGDRYVSKRVLEILRETQQA